MPLRTCQQHTLYQLRNIPGFVLEMWRSRLINEISIDH